jgi:hypothetical protein
MEGLSELAAREQEEGNVVDGKRSTYTFSAK